MTPVRAIRRFTVRPVLPEVLKPLGDLARNLLGDLGDELHDPVHGFRGLAQLHGRLVGGELLDAGVDPAEVHREIRPLGPGEVDAELALDAEGKALAVRLTAYANMGGYLATVPDLPGCMSDGESREQAAHNVGDAIAAWIEEARALGRTVPAPSRKLAVAQH